MVRIISTLIYFFCKYFGYIFIARGYLTLDTFKEILRELDGSIPENELDGIVDEIDVDGSGTVDFEGTYRFHYFITFMQSFIRREKKIHHHRYHIHNYY